MKMEKETMSRKLKRLGIVRFKFVAYILGWVCSLSLIFWLIMLACKYASSEEEDRFFSDQFHQRVWKFGVYLFICIVVYGILTLWDKFFN